MVVAVVLVVMCAVGGVGSLLRSELRASEVQVQPPTPRPPRRRTLRT